jgi:hypothetical protein
MYLYFGSNNNLAMCHTIGTDIKVGVRFPALPDFLRSGESGKVAAPN